MNIKLLENLEKRELLTAGEEQLIDANNEAKDWDFNKLYLASQFTRDASLCFFLTWANGPEQESAKDLFRPHTLGVCSIVAGISTLAEFSIGGAMLSSAVGATLNFLLSSLNPSTTEKLPFKNVH